MSKKKDEKVVDLRQRMRQATVTSAAEPARDIVEIGDLEFEVRSLSYKDKKAVNKAATTTSFDAKSGKADVQFDQEEYELEMLIRSVFVPDTDERVFEPHDKDNLRGQFVGKDHWMQKLMDAASEINSTGN